MKKNKTFIVEVSILMKIITYHEKWESEFLEFYVFSNYWHSLVLKTQSELFFSFNFIYIVRMISFELLYEVSKSIYGPERFHFC